MKKTIIYITLLTFLTSCDYFEFKPKKKEVEEPFVASIYDTKLYLSDIKNITPKNISVQDSLVFIKAYINSWAKQQLFLKKAEENITEVNSNEIKNLVKNYRESLFINGYKERLIKQQLDTVISNTEIDSFYHANKDNFKLKENLLQLKYIYFGNNFLDKKEVIKKFKSSKEEDLEYLEDLTINYKDYHLRDSTWLTLNEVLQKLPPFKAEPKQKLLKLSKFIQKEDSLGVYLVAVQGVLKQNDIAPLSYIRNNIKQLILHKRKLELIRNIEKTLINDAIKNKTFKEY
ncbi:MAG: hypothetical protein KGV59_04540 [Tenacibaculum sp.]|nr:hypothetical protein [Tenacibaculum sp.]